MKKTISALLVLALIFSFSSAVALEETVLPFGIRYNMTEQEVTACLAGAGVYEMTADEYYTFYSFERCDGLFGSVAAENLGIEVNWNNSLREKQFSMIEFSIPFEGNVITAFRGALAEFTALYGEPDEDPFLDVESYVGYGSLAACWTKEDVFIVLNMTRLYTDSLSGYISRRVCFDAEDLNE